MEPSSPAEHPPEGADPSRTTAVDRPASLLLVASGLGLEALLLVAVAVGFVQRLPAASSLALAGGTAVMALALALLLAAAARGLLRRRRWGRAPALVWQLLQTVVALQLALGAETGSGRWWTAVGLVVLGVAVGAPLVTRAVTAYASEPQRSPEEERLI